ncbi:hypothetical protein P3T24_005831 [Paraburkholderia sp. GAS33]|uniref:hypothetical protein n=1 Tax=Paraburkholderia sp. GAS33 TaxID=3035130 RepID=UPI003D19D36E
MLGLKEQTHIEEVIFVDDFFRVSENGLFASLENRKFLRTFFGVAASRLGWRVREVCAQSQGGTIPVPKLMEALGLPQSAEGWAAACTADLKPAAEHLGALALTPTSLVIGWGLSPSIMQYVDGQGASFIDVEIHAIRFTRDLHLAVRTNDPAIRHELERMRIPEEAFWSAAAGLRAYFARRGQPFIVRPDLSVGLFVGQTALDLALVGDGRLMRPADFVTQIAMWARQVDLLVISPHPAQANADLLDALLDSVPNAALVSSNTYNLLCAENLAFVAGISTGVLKEAHYLGCSDIRQLLADDRNAVNLLPATCSPWIPVRLEIASLRSLQAFARARQSWWHRTVPQFSLGQHSTFPEDMLNHIFGYRWGFDLAADGLPKLPELVPEQPLSLAAGAPGAVHALFGRGWHGSEDWGVWSGEGRAYLVVSLGSPSAVAPIHGFELSLHGRMYVPACVEPPAVHILINGHESQARVSQDGGLEWVIHLGADAIEHRLLIISVDVRGAVRPCDVGENADTRILGVGLEYLTVRELDKSFPML